MRILSMLTCGVLISCLNASADDALPTAERLRELLSTPAATGLIPELDSADPKALAERPAAKELLKEAAKLGPAIPQTTYTLYRQFQANGDRKGYETPYFDKRECLADLAMAAWLTGDDARIPDINDVLWSICEETTWVLPAHEKHEIDLFASETGSELGQVLLVLGDRLPEEVRNRVRDEVRRRIIEPYLQRGAGYSWGAGHNNWTGVCAGSVGESFLLFEPDPDRQAQALANVIVQLHNFTQNAFAADGASLEGISYWCYGLLHYVGFAEMLRARTNGAIDLLADPRLKQIATYPAAVALDRYVFASFSDSHEHAAIPLCLASRIAERTGVEALLGQADDTAAWRFSTRLRNLLWAKGVPEGEAVIEPAFLPASGIGKLVGEAKGARVVLAAKAGYNDEPHNQNDIGSFILRVGKQTYLCDPGAGLYSRDYFSKKRYDNVFANSYGHSVPRIGGQLQKTGAQYKGTIEKAGDNALRIDMTGAYGLPELKRAVRTLTLQPDGTVTMDTEYAFEGAGLEVEEAFVTWLPVEVDGSTARLMSPEGTLTLRADTGTFKVEALEDACKANAVTDKMLTRVTLTTAPGAKSGNRYTFTYAPGK
jgi:hypothetical protein